MRPSMIVTGFLALSVIACSGSTEEPPEGATAVVADQTQLPTGDPYARGYTDADFPRIKELAPNVYSYEQLRSAGEEKFTTVSLFVVGPTGVLVADGQGSVEETQRLIDHIAEITGAPITEVVIASDHGDHTAGNSAFSADASFYAHPTSLANLERSAASPRRGEDAPPVVLPTHLVEHNSVLNVGDIEVQLLFLGRAHTGGDLVVYLPAEKILFMSEAYLHRIFPATRSAYPTEWVTMIEASQAMNVDIYVPGHGFVDCPEVLAAELEVYRLALVQIIDEVTRLHSAGATVEEAIEMADFGDLQTWSLRESQRPTAIRRIYLELNGELP